MIGDGRDRRAARATSDDRRERRGPRTGDGGRRERRTTSELATRATATNPHSRNADFWLPDARISITFNRNYQKTPAQNIDISASNCYIIAVKVRLILDWPECALAMDYPPV
jgi:hypothetical protein